MGKRRILAIATGTVLAATGISAPAADAASTNCFKAIGWPVTGNWDGIGGDGIGVVEAHGDGLWWYLRDAPNSGKIDYQFRFGRAGDQPVVGNWDGMGGDGPGTVRPVKVSDVFDDWHWELRDVPDGGNPKYVFDYGRAYAYGLRTYLPVTGNWDGVGGDGPGVAGGDANGSKAWHLRDSATGGDPDYNLVYGQAGLGNDKPMAGDWDGDGRDGPGVVRTTNDRLSWLERNELSSGTADIGFDYGVASDCNVVGDWDGIGGDGPGVVRGASGGRLEWHLRNGAGAGEQPSVFLYP
ncbi:hypothetical protein Amsp01_081790 [Amycolatopsis sp. NBRC 101858]|uniref:hypothetical protein n=1 Tax=Amycolatopsis sp. NBRC 101858 TaxID=3032200 RepID=UPI0024A42897|nr:hypothetical protein [Amycolatopsis sp. NBRC 101858]GLY42156.1 hypothetical protein Amsp01_081790 [Amycolatopsis sp. NBRC 101858]